MVLGLARKRGKVDVRLNDAGRVRLGLMIATQLPGLPVIASVASPRIGGHRAVGVSQDAWVQNEDVWFHEPAGPPSSSVQPTRRSRRRPWERGARYRRWRRAPRSGSGGDHHGGRREHRYLRLLRQRAFWPSGMQGVLMASDHLISFPFLAHPNCGKRTGTSRDIASSVGDSHVPAHIVALTALLTTAAVSLFRRW